MMRNKIPVLDKGYVAPINFSLGGTILGDLQNQFFSGKINSRLLDVASMVLEIRCPLFFQIFLQRQHGLKIVSTIERDIEYYIPDISEIKAQDLGISREIHEHIKQTVEAINLTSIAFQKDGMSKFTSQILTPVSVYNTVIVGGALTEWMGLIYNSDNAPTQIQAYIAVIKAIMESEWPEMQTYLKGQK